MQPAYQNANVYPWGVRLPAEERTRFYASAAAQVSASESAEDAAERASSNALRAAETFSPKMGNLERIEHLWLLHEIFGNPFRPVTIDPRWLTSTVVDLAQAIYQEKAFDRMPILADALMDAGCDSDEMILHCRGGGPHVRGCWVIDLLLGKE